MVSQGLGMPSSKLSVQEKKKLQFDSLWEECVQEKERVANREAILLSDEDQDLVVHAKGGKKKSHFNKETHFHKESLSKKILEIS
jgi:hypothetical protein